MFGAHPVFKAMDCQEDDDNEIWKLSAYYIFGAGVSGSVEESKQPKQDK